MKFKEYLKENAVTGHLTDRAEIEQWLSGRGIINYTIRDDGTVDVGDPVDLHGNRCHHLPVKFGVINGFFNISRCGMRSLENCPHTVHGTFKCADNKLVTLIGGPSTVGGDYNCRSNALSTLEGAPKFIQGEFDATDNGLESMFGAPEEIIGDFSATENHLTSFEFAPKRVHGNFNIGYNNISSFADISKYIDTIDGNLNLHSNSYKITGGIGLLLIKGIRSFYHDSDKALPFQIIKKYLGRPDDIFECQAELIEQGFEEYAVL